MVCPGFSRASLAVVKPGALHSTGGKSGRPSAPSWKDCTNEAPDSWPKLAGKAASNSDTPPAAAKQCQRAVVPTFAGVMSLAELWVEPRHATVWASLEPAAAGGRTGPAWQAPARPVSVLLLVGPEGGWSAAEVEEIAAHGAHAVSLGPRTLRAEAVPTVAMAALWSTWGWT